MAQIVNSFEINHTTVWIVIQRLYCSTNGTKKLIEANEFVCYFNFLPPSDIIFGELIRDEHQKPKLFTTPEQAEIFAIEYVRKKFDL